MCCIPGASGLVQWQTCTPNMEAAVSTEVSETYQMLLFCSKVASLISYNILLSCLIFFLDCLVCHCLSFCLVSYLNNTKQTCLVFCLKSFPSFLTSNSSFPVSWLKFLIFLVSKEISFVFCISPCPVLWHISLTHFFSHKIL